MENIVIDSTNLENALESLKKSVQKLNENSDKTIQDII